jgi:hypothetical protein
MGNTINKFFINRHGTTVEDYTTVVVPELNNIIKRIPDRIDVSLTATVDDKFSKLALGRDYEVSGRYSFALPMAFDSLNIVYVETIDGIKEESNESGDQLGEYIDKIGLVTLSFDVLNTIPFGITPEITAYDSEGKLLEDLDLTIEGSIEKGNGAVNGVVTEPVVSHVVVKLKALELTKLDKIDISLEGEGSGVFNANEYIQLKNIVISIDEPVTVDLNELKNN